MPLWAEGVSYYTKVRDSIISTTDLSASSLSKCFSKTADHKPLSVRRCELPKP